jgi:hypothetical protein
MLNQKKQKYTRKSHKTQNIINSNNNLNNQDSEGMLAWRDTNQALTVIVANGSIKPSTLSSS